MTLLLLLSVCIFAAGNAYADIWQIDIEGAIGPATADHMIRGLEQAEAADAELVLIRIDTPGGLDLSMRDMIKAILAARVPVVGYVSPGGARAASAGTYLLYATHIAAMAPGTNLGAATPVQIGGPSLPRMPSAEEGGQPGQATPAVGKSPMEHKIVNDAVAYIQSLSQLRGRNAEWAERAVREGASLSAEDALQMGVIDLMADSVAELLDELDGRVVEVAGSAVTLVTAELAIVRHSVDWRSEFLGVITNPNIAYMLMLAGIYGLLIEFYNPGVGLPGVIGAVCLLLALYALQLLPVSYAGLGLILLGVALMTAEAFAPSFGILGPGGIVAFVFGSIMLMDTDLPGYQIAMPMIAAFTVFSVGILVVALGLILKARRQELVSGLDHLLGVSAEIEYVRDNVAWARLDGELWEVSCDTRLAPHDPIVVDAIDGVTLLVSKQKEESS
ncbi:NfeD family protein [Candidatus Litorirhabdus singularis]|nr:nodulation protein NfeD [Candidatus Litorirhabdus singularis]